MKNIPPYDLVFGVNDTSHFIDMTNVKIMMYQNSGGECFLKNASFYRGADYA